MCAGVAIWVSLSSTAAFASGDSLLDHLGDKARGVVEKVTGGSKSSSKSKSSNEL